MPTLNYTTRVPALKTVGECQTALVEHGARSVTTLYSPTAQPTALAFTLTTPHGDRPYTLTLDIEAMRRQLARESRDKGAHSKAKMTIQNFTGEAHAADVTWRVAKDWLLAQLAMVAAAQVPIEEIMLPYLMVTPNSSLREVYREREASAMAIGG